MASTIQLKRGNSTNLPTLTLAAGEPAFALDTGKLYVGTGSNKVEINPLDKPTGLVTGTAYTKYTVNDYGQIITQSNLVETDIPDLSYTKITGLGTAATRDTGIAADNVPILDTNGKLAASTLPAIAVTDTFVVDSETAMLALTAEVGDIAVRTDINETFILQTAPASVLANWIMFRTPTGNVSSVNGQTGTVVLGAGDILMTGYTEALSYTPIAATDTSSAAIGKLEKNFDSFAPLDSAALTGTPTSTTPITTDDSTRIATTSYVKGNLTSYASLNSPVFTGIPTAPTAAAGESSTQIATTAFVTGSLTVIDGGTF